jgi:hypothetical protein
MLKKLALSKFYQGTQNLPSCLFEVCMINIGIWLFWLHTTQNYIIHSKGLQSQHTKNSNSITLQNIILFFITRFIHQSIFISWSNLTCIYELHPFLTQTSKPPKQCMVQISRPLLWANCEVVNPTFVSFS